MLSRIHYNLGAVASQTNDGAACLVHNRIFLQLRQTAAKTHNSARQDPLLAHAYNQMGVAKMMSGMISDAEVEFRNSIFNYSNLETFKRSMLCFPRTNLGLCLWLQNKLTEASTILEVGLAEREEDIAVLDDAPVK